MRLDFVKEDWLHIVMAVRIAQKVLTQGEYKTQAWDRRRGSHIIGQLLRLVKQEGHVPQVATKIELSHLLNMLPENTETPLVASSTTLPPAPPAPPPPPPPAVPDPAQAQRLDDLERQVIALMLQVEAKPQPAASAQQDEVAGLREYINDQNVRIFTYLDQLEDRLRALEAKR